MGYSALCVCVCVCVCMCSWGEVNEGSLMIIGFTIKHNRTYQRRGASKLVLAQLNCTCVRQTSPESYNAKF